jgi:hypothetical protein
MTLPGRTGRIMQETTVIETFARVKMSGPGTAGIAVSDVVWMFTPRPGRVQQAVRESLHCGTNIHGRVGGHFVSEGAWP